MVNNFRQIGCFDNNIKLWKVLGMCPKSVTWQYYKYYSIVILALCNFIYIIFPTINFYFVPKHIDDIIEEMLFYFTEINVLSKVLTFMIWRGEIQKLFETLESDIFQPDTADGHKTVDNAKKLITTYWKIYTRFSLICHLSHVLSPLILHWILSTKLQLPLCSYSFLPEEFKNKYIYPLYFYQVIGMHFDMWVNVTVDSFFLGIMILIIAQLDILDEKLRNLTNKNFGDTDINISDAISTDNDMIVKMTRSIIHFTEVSKFCNLVEEIFSITVFVQFSVASALICACLFRFTVPAPWQYFIFLGLYILLMILQILLPCWFGTRIFDKSYQLSQAIYSCDWTPRSRRFKINLRLFVERANRPLTITGGKMFLVSLSTFTSIMNSAYSFYTLLRHMKSREP